jgi:4-alpha-glucanotransferase
MRFDGLSRYLTGVLVPVSALRSDENLGVGEFADIPALADWCLSVGLDLIQLLPVNDSGGESSPYSALSAFALHPMYLRITDLPELDALPAADRGAILDSINAIRKEHADAPRIRYRELLDAKLAVVTEIFSRTTVDDLLRADLDRFISDNGWIHQYAAFKVLKAVNDERSWKEWDEYRDPTPADIDAVWADDRFASSLTFHVWLQMRLEGQFCRVARQVADAGIVVKGDLPILMNEDSADVWAHRSWFITRLRAGAPPDMFTSLGQNWGLPIYNWDRLAENGYQWWKDRLRQAAKFYAAYRIDHVLGFFRVWAIPEHNYSGLLGRFFPSVAASRDRLREIGLDDGRIRWLAEPHLTGDEIRKALLVETDEAIALAFDQIGDEDLYTFRDSINGERDIQGLALSEPVRQWLIGRYADRALIALEDDCFAPTWSFRSCSRYQQIQEHEKAAFERLVNTLGAESEGIWEDQARRLLGFMRESTDMLVCAEDLGVIPSAVPRVLNDLGMLGLRIPRWARLWDQPGQPYVPPSEFPFLTVCAPSVHDTSTMRGWWDEEPGNEAFWICLGLEGPVPEAYDAPTAKKVTAAILETGSSICVLQLQDILALSSAIRGARPDEERVNIPGTVNDINWSYRLPLGVGKLAAQKDLSEVLRLLLERRRSRPVDSP